MSAFFIFFFSYLISPHILWLKYDIIYCTQKSLQYDTI